MVGRAVKLNAESSSHLICRKRGAMNLPFGNASAIKYRKKDVQPSWAGLAQETGPGPPAAEGTRGGGGGLPCSGGAR